MKVYKNIEKEQWLPLLKRPSGDSGSLKVAVKEIIAAVKEGGDTALLQYNRQFDDCTDGLLCVSREEFEAAASAVPDDLKNAIVMAKANIEKFHRNQLREEATVETSEGIFCWRKSLPIEKVGLYVPGGSAPLFSTLLMLGIPARIAGCQDIVVCTPAKNDRIHPALLYTASLLGINRVFKTGGAQAIAAMAYGTETISPVDKIFGPGNSYVTLAKQLVNASGTAIDMPAGPSEVAVYADETSNPDFVAADLLSQAEHGTDSQVILVSVSGVMVNRILECVDRQRQYLRRTKEINSSLSNSRAFILGSEKECFELLNAYAPEHLIIASDKSDTLANAVMNAGSVFLGHYAPESAGDYISGTNHTLPTNGFAKSYSGVSVDSFVKKITFQHLTASGLQRVSEAIGTMADAEGLPAHRNAVDVRISNLKECDTGSKVVPFRNIESLVRKNILALMPYSSARSEFKGAAEIYLDANENAFGSPAGAQHNRYPDPLQMDLKQMLSGMKGVRPENICIGNGSDEIIDHLIKVFCVPGKDNVIVMPPTFKMYAVAASVNDVEVRSVLLNDNFQPVTEAVLHAVDDNTKIIFVCSPNNPTGNSIDHRFVQSLLQEFKGIVVIDEAYIDFSVHPSFVPQIKSHNNLVILQTLSKAWGLAGLRIGMALAGEQVTALLNKVKMPYNISSATQQLVIEALKNEKTVAGWIADLKVQRSSLAEQLVTFPFVRNVYPSDANFLLVRVVNVALLYRYLLRNGIVVRNQESLPRLENCLRITVGSPGENTRLVEFLKNYSV